MPHTQELIFLDDGEIAIVTPGSIALRSLDDRKVIKQSHCVAWDMTTAQKGGYEHFMLKEMLEQPEVVENSTRVRIDLLGARAVLWVDCGT